MQAVGVLDMNLTVHTLQWAFYIVSSHFADPSWLSISSLYESHSIESSVHFNLFFFN